MERRESWAATPFGHVGTSAPRRRSVPAKGRLLIAFLAVIGLAVVGVTGAHWWQQRVSDEAIVGERLREFPAIDTVALEPLQARIVDVTATEYAAPGAGVKYAEGVVESWCADFVSWVMREAGAPLSNPNSGSWRIPGVYTLQEYYESTGRFEAVGTGYRPRTGDVVLYHPDSPFGQHTNIVLLADGDLITTIGGNENDAVRIHRFAMSEVPAIVGFGRL